MQKLLIKENKNIRDKIYIFRGKQVMFASDLAKIYECKNGTKEINQAVSRNKDKFPERISFILSQEEIESFLVTNCDRKSIFILKVGLSSYQANGLYSFARTAISFGVKPLVS